MSEGKSLTTNELELCSAVDAVPSILFKEVREQVVEQEQTKRCC